MAYELLKQTGELGSVLRTGVRKMGGEVEALVTRAREGPQR